MQNKHFMAKPNTVVYGPSYLAAGSDQTSWLRDQIILGRSTLKNKKNITKNFQEQTSQNHLVKRTRSCLFDHHIQCIT